MKQAACRCPVRFIFEAVRGTWCPWDAAFLMRWDDGVLVPLVAHGLAPEALGRTVCAQAHPRLDLLCHAEPPVRLPPVVNSGIASRGPLGPRLQVRDYRCRVVEAGAALERQTG